MNCMAALESSFYNTTRAKQQNTSKMYMHMYVHSMSIIKTIAAKANSNA